MAKLTGIRSIDEMLLHPLGDFSSLIPSLKQQCLLFDSIGFMGLDKGDTGSGVLIAERNKPEVEWLKEQNIIYSIDWPKQLKDEEGASDFSKYLSDIGMGDDYWESFVPIYEQSFKDLKVFTQKSKTLRRKSWSKLKPLLENPSTIDAELSLKKAVEKLIFDVHELVKYFGNAEIRRESIAARYISVRTMYYEKIDAVSLIPYYVFPEIPSSKKSEIARLIIRKLPVPNETTPWEQIIEFRNDPQNQTTLLGLRRWIRKISAEHLTVMEIEQELEWLLNEFESHMKLHNIKSNANTLEVWVKTPLELLENLVTLKFSKLSDPFFALQKRKISLMEAELQAPGREVAYILKAKDRFKNK